MVWERAVPEPRSVLSSVVVIVNGDLDNAKGILIGPLDYQYESSDSEGTDCEVPKSS